jgi:methionine-rich copper-binding protein CopC
MRRLLLVAALSLITAPQASAHAILLHAEPPNGAILLTAPRYVSVTFDSTVRVGPRNAAIRNDGTNVLAGAARIAPGNQLVIHCAAAWLTATTRCAGYAPTTATSRRA